MSIVPVLSTLLATFDAYTGNFEGLYLLPEATATPIKEEGI
jgi:hypothetical protein